MNKEGATRFAWSCNQWGVVTQLLWGAGAMGQVPMTLEDFHLPGTQVGDVSPAIVGPSENCSACHGNYDLASEPFNTWRGSLMGQAGRDPLFYAQMATANQDVANVGYYCMRCHVPFSFLTGSAYQPDGSTIDETDRDGVSCHFCHSMVDPVYKPGISPPQDEAILSGLTAVPSYYGNSMFVLDPSGLRRGPYANAQPPHAFVQSDFFRRGDFCGTCHDVGNVAVTRLTDGTYRYNNLNQPTPTEDPAGQFPLERTYTEWKLSAFAQGGVDMGGRFGGDGGTTVSTCQDCHMPRTSARGCFFGPERGDLARHDFAGASAWVLEIIGLYHEGDPAVDQSSLVEGRQKAIDMLSRAVSLELEQNCGGVRVRVINESGHKIPTGHIEGRRIWADVKVFGAESQLLREYGHYDDETAHLDESSTDVYEMHVGLSDYASFVTGYPVGVTTHMALADTIEKDNRIPPRGFNNAAYEAAGAPVVGSVYEDGQYWDDTYFWLPDEASNVEVTVNYQTVTRHYIEALRDGNVTNDWGDILYQLWLDTNKGAPIPMATQRLDLSAFVRGDDNGNGGIDLADLGAFLECAGDPNESTLDGCQCMDFEGDRDTDLADFAAFQRRLGGQ